MTPNGTLPFVKQNSKKKSSTGCVQVDLHIYTDCCIVYMSLYAEQYIGEMETRFIDETDMVFGNFEGKDVRSGSFTVEPF